MFSGIIEEIGTVKKIFKKGTSLTLTVQANKILKDMKKGDSISVSGVCLTVIGHNDSSFSTEVSPETIKKSNLGDIKEGDKVNLERALKIGDRLMGHMVSGHIDGTGIIVKKEKKGDFIETTFQVPKELMKYIVEKGSVAIDGASLTALSCKEDTFKISFIPYTINMTTFRTKDIGDSVNLECDIIGKYTESFLSREEKEKKKLSREFLKEHGFI